MAAHGSFLSHREFLWLRRAGAVALLAVVAYVSYDPIGGRNGGTAMGYALGGIGAALILWLSWLGVRKRSFAGRRSRRARPTPPEQAAQTLKGWTSAHVYLGLALLVIGTLHTGFEFGWNVHTLTYALMVLVILSGVYGIFAYSRYPALASENLAGESVERIRRALGDIDQSLSRLAGRLPDAFAGPVRDSINTTKIGGGALKLLSGSSSACATARALRESRAAALEDHGAEPAAVSELIALLSRKADLCARLRRDNAYKARMDVMLWFHVPVTIALIGSLIAHVVVVFFYW
jgi:hypothetical protein